GMGNCLFKLKVGRVSKSAKDETGILFPAEVSRQTRVGKDFDRRRIGECLLNKRFSVFKTKHILLIGVHSDSDNDLIKQGDAAADDVVMSKGDGIKRTRKYSF